LNAVDRAVHVIAVVVVAAAARHRHAGADAECGDGDNCDDGPCPPCALRVPAGLLFHGRSPSPGMAGRVQAPRRTLLMLVLGVDTATDCAVVGATAAGELVREASIAPGPGGGG